MAHPPNWDEVDFAWGQGNLPPWAVPDVPEHRGSTCGSYRRDTEDRMMMMHNLRANDMAHGNTAHYPMRKRLYQNARKYDYNLAMMERRHDHPYLGERLLARELADVYSKPPKKPSRPVMFYTYGKHFHKYHKGARKPARKYQIPTRTPPAFLKKYRFGR